MRPGGGRRDACACQSVAHERSNRLRADEAAHGRFGAHKDAPAAAGRPSVPQIGGDGRADLGGKGQRREVMAFPSHAHLAAGPVQVLKLEADHFARSQAEPREPEQDRVVATPDRRMPINGGEHLAHRGGGNRSRNRGHRPLRDGGHRSGQILDDIPAGLPVAQKRSQRRRQDLRAFPMQAWRASLHEANDIASGHARERDGPVPNQSSRKARMNGT